MDLDERAGLARTAIPLSIVLARTCLIDSSMKTYYNVYMNTHSNARRMNITLPRDITERLRNKPNKSAYIAQAVREKFAAEDESRRKAALAKAYRDASSKEAVVRDEWDVMAGDGLA